MELIAALKLCEVGDEVDVWASDRGSAKDIPEWVAKVGHEVVSNEEKDGYWSIVVKKTK